MVLDAAHPVDAAHPGDTAHPGLSVPLDGLLAGQVVRVHTVTWTGHGPRFSAFTQPLTAHPAVSFSAAGTPYLVSVITAATPLVPPAPPVPTTLSCTRAPAPRAPAGPPGRCWVVLAVRRPSHEARAALAPGGIT